MSHVATSRSPDAGPDAGKVSLCRLCKQRLDMAWRKACTGGKKKKRAEKQAGRKEEKKGMKKRQAGRKEENKGRKRAHARAHMLGKLYCIETLMHIRLVVGDHTAAESCRIKNHMKKSMVSGTLQLSVELSGWCILIDCNLQSALHQGKMGPPRVV